MACPHFSLLCRLPFVGYSAGVTRIDMKMLSGLAQFTGRRSTWRWILCLAVGLLAVILVSGCGKQSAVPVSSAPQPTNQTASTPAPSATPNSQVAPPTPADNANAAGPNLQVLNHELMGWVLQNHRRPKSFEEFAANANVKIPPPPAGKKYTLNGRGFITLVDN